MAELEKQTPVAQNVCGSLRRDGHWKCLGLTLMIVVCLATIVWCQFDKTDKKVLPYMDIAFSSSDRSGSCKEGYVYIPVACVVILYLVYLVECWHSHAWLQLKYKCDIATVYNTIRKMQEALPAIWWKATCYHYLRRSRQVMRYRNGDAFTSTQVYYERVDSNTAGAAFNFTRCGVKDISRPLSDLEKYAAVKIKISKGFSFANLDTEYEFEEQRSQFFQEHETKDDYMEGREGMDLINVDFKEYIIAFKDPNNLPWYVSRAVFWFGSLILLSWPLRAIIEFKTAHLHYHIHKLFGSNYLGSDNCPGMITRVSTMNSTEFEMSIRNNNVIVPSYSEAMLVDIHEQQRRDYGAIKTYPSKFPRSLTNATLAGRSTWRSTTPTVMMNQVKKFKSCNVLENSESTDPPLPSGSFRYHVRQLMRERGRKQVKTSVSLSHSSIFGFFRNENVGRNRCSIETSDGATSASICFRSIGPSNPSSAVSGAALSGVQALPSSDDVQCYDIDLQIVTSLGTKLPNRHPKSPLSRSKSVPDSNSTGGCILSHIMSGEEPLTESLSNISDIRHELNNDPSSSKSECYNINIFPSPLTVTTPPPTPSSPPDYEEAIKMRLISPSLLSKPALNSVDDASEIGFTEKSSSELPMSSFSVTRARAGLGDKGDTNLVLLAGPIDSGIDIGRSVQSAGHNSDDSKKNISREHSRTYSGEGTIVSKLTSSRQRHQLHLSNKLKPLPNVSKIIYPGAEDSDFGCLHGTYSELGDFDNVPDSEDCLPNRASQLRTFGIGSISRLAVSLIAQDGMCDPATSLTQSLNRNPPSASVSTSAVTHVRTPRLHTFSSHRLETSV